MVLTLLRFSLDSPRSFSAIGKQAGGLVQARPLPTIPMVSPHAGVT